MQAGGADGSTQQVAARAKNTIDGQLNFPDPQHGPKPQVLVQQFQEKVNVSTLALAALPRTTYDQMTVKGFLSANLQNLRALHQLLCLHFNPNTQAHGAPCILWQQASSVMQGVACLSF